MTNEHGYLLTPEPLRVDLPRLVASTPWLWCCRSSGPCTIRRFCPRLSAIALPLALVLAHLCYLYFERRFMALGKRFAAGAARGQAAPAGGEGSALPQHG